MIFSSSKCPLPALVAWCRTLKHSIGAGLDVVRIFRQLAKSGPFAMRKTADDIAGALGRGESFEDALEPHRDRFPPLFVEMVIVGEHAGRLEDTFRELEQYYETTMRVQRNFRSQMIYPFIQYVLAVIVIALFLWIYSMLVTPKTGKAATVFGFSGAGGAISFLIVAFGFLGVLLFLAKMSADSVRWRARMEGMFLSVPAWGPALLNFAMQRFCLAMRMTHEAGLRAEQVLGYCFRATANSVFQRREPAAVAVAARGGELHEALAACGAPFPEDFLQSVVVAEESGQVSEVMERLAENYREEAERRLREAAQYTAYLMYAAVGVMIIIAIFTIASQYLGMLGAAAGG
jgi:type II secretory pathway component PulF